MATLIIIIYFICCAILPRRWVQDQVSIEHIAIRGFLVGFVALLFFAVTKYFFYGVGNGEEFSIGFFLWLTPLLTALIFYLYACAEFEGK